jgi:hypothetical protein
MVTQDALACLGFLHQYLTYMTHSTLEHVARVGMRKQGDGQWSASLPKAQKYGPKVKTFFIAYVKLMEHK